MDTQKILSENERRREVLDKPYDPLTGEGCVGNRVHLEISDAPIKSMFLPEPMMSENICILLKDYGSISALYEAQGQELTEEEWAAFWIRFCELRIKYDYEFYALMYQTIEDGNTAQEIPFRLKRAQREMLSVLEDLRLRNEPIRAIVLKARQMGLSTLTQLYMEWIQSVHKKNWHSIICAHVKDGSTSIRAMYDKVVENQPPINEVKHTISPFKNAQNIKIIPERGCRITIGSAEKPESVRSQNPKMAHFSEVAFFPNTTMKGTGKLIGGIVGSMKLDPLTIQIYESTANGVGDYFHSLWEKAKKGTSIHRPIFLPWYNDDRYSISLSDGYFYNLSGIKTEGAISDFVISMSGYEKILFNNHPNCTLENIHWYRLKKSEMTSDELMLQEYPSDDIEAFQNSGIPAFRASDIEGLRGNCADPVAIGTLAADCPASWAKMDARRRNEVLSNIKFIKDDEALAASNDPQAKERKERNKLKIWDFPDTSVKMSSRYVVVFDPQKGISEKADYGVIAVFDRYWMAYGGKPEIVAEWRGRIDKDITIWIAAQIAKYYNNALLVVESNTYDSDFKEDGAEFIFDTIADYYSNLYSRTPADKIIEGMPVEYGFNTNRSTKPMIKDNFVAMLREKGYVERNSMALDEARIYEQKKNGAFGAKNGGHDDILMTRMIGCHICYDLPLPTIIEERRKSPNRGMISESSF